MKPRLDPELRTTPTKKSELVSLDLMIPSRNVQSTGRYNAALLLWVTDRESAIGSKAFLKHLTDKQIRYKLISRDPHGDFNPYADKLIGVLQTMARAALLHMEHDDTILFAVKF